MALFPVKSILAMRVYKRNLPCFPHKKTQVVQPEETVQHKNVHRYGETNIRRANAPMPVDQWRKNRNSDPNQRRQLPQTPRENVVKEDSYSRLPPQDPKNRALQTEEHLASTPKQPFRQQSRPSQPLKADFFVSVPIFTETLNHSFRKKNEYVYVDAPEDEGSVYHQSLSRGSSLRDLRPESARRPPTGSTHYSARQTSSVRKLKKRAPKEHRRRHYSGSEASFNTYSSRGTYGYESETFENPRLLQGQRTKSGLSVGSDDEDLR